MSDSSDNDETWELSAMDLHDSSDEYSDDEDTLNEEDDQPASVYFSRDPELWIKDFPIPPAEEMKYVPSEINESIHLLQHHHL